MKEPICEFCTEYTQCSCRFETCALCKNSYSNYDPDESHQMFEYRGVLGCSKCIDEVTAKRDFQRQEVMEEVEHSVRSQADGEWQSGGYKYMKTDSGGRPITKIKEPMRLKDYEDGKL